MKTYKMTIPSAELNNVENFVAKMSKYINATIDILSDPYNKVYRHATIDAENFVVITKEIHSVVDIIITLDKCDWEVLCEIKQGFLIPIDKSKKLVFKNPAHGLNYPICDCCKHHISNSSYVIVNTITGEELQVGPSCATKFGIENLTTLYKYTKELYALYNMYQSDMEPMPTWKGNTYGFVCEEIENIMQVAYNYYIENNGNWDKAFYLGNTYYKSKSAETIKTNVLQHNYELKDVDLIKKVIEYIKTIHADSDFNIDMKRYVCNVYGTLNKSYLAFFAIKAYFSNIEKENIGINKGESFHIIGKITKIEHFEGNYGDYILTYIISNSGQKFIRKGKVPYTTVDNDEKLIDIYATVKFISNSCDVFLDRCTMNPKKNIDYKTI